MLSTVSSTIPQPPVWLPEEHEIVALLGAVVDRFDDQPGEARQRNVSLPVEPYLPSLMRADAAADHSWSLILALVRSGLCSVRAGRREPLDPEWIGARLVFPLASEAVLREWLQRERAPSALHRWREAVRQHAAAFPKGCDALLARRIVVPGRSDEEVAGAFARMATVRGSMTLRQLSALVFWGDSKVLDDRAELIAALFPQLEIRERALVVAVHLPQAPRGVLFIENQDTYTATAMGALRTAADYALVYAAGFRGAAERVRSRTGAMLHFSGEGHEQGCAAFSSWWFGQADPPGPCWFWGDLDFAGMQILKALRSRFGEVAAWQPGYEPMLAALRMQGGYATPGQQDPGVTGCPYADEVLLPAIRAHGQVDQEVWRPEQSMRASG